jgi:hypothetical protein
MPSCPRAGRRTRRWRWSCSTASGRTSWICPRATDAAWQWIDAHLAPDAKVATVGFSQGGLMATIGDQEIADVRAFLDERIAGIAR